MQSKVIPVLEELNAGYFVRDCNDRLAELLKAIEETRNGGSITIKLDVTLSDDSTVMVSPTCAIKKPYIKRGSSLLFMKDGKLSKDHPDQQPLFPDNVTVIDGGRDKEDLTEAI